MKGKRRKPTNLKGMAKVLLTEKGYVVGDVERFIRNIRFDFCGFADLIAFNACETLAVQVCQERNLKEHRDKIEANEKAKAWIVCQRRLVLLSAKERVQGQWKRHQAKFWTWTFWHATKPDGDTLVWLKGPTE